MFLITYQLFLVLSHVATPHGISQNSGGYLVVSISSPSNKRHILRGSIVPVTKNFPRTDQLLNAQNGLHLKILHLLYCLSLAGEVIVMRWAFWQNANIKLESLIFRAFYSTLDFISYCWQLWMCGLVSLSNLWTLHSLCYVRRMAQLISGAVA